MGLVHFVNPTDKLHPRGASGPVEAGPRACGAPLAVHPGEHPRASLPVKAAAATAEITLD